LAEVFEIGDNFGAKCAKKVVSDRGREVAPIRHVYKRSTRWIEKECEENSGAKKDFHPHVD
jgi:hypothetical protein